MIKTRKSKVNPRQMSQNAHIFTPEDKSLEARIKACKEVLIAHRNAELSLKLAKEKGKDKQETLGEFDEIQYAYTITNDSLNKAIKSLTPAELKLAKEDRLFTSSEIKQIQVFKTKENLKQLRQPSKSHQKKL